MSNHSRKVSVSARSRAVKNPLSLPARIGVLLLILMLSSMALITPASAATITVGNTGDPATGNAANCNVASTCTLRDAIAKAANVTGTAAGDTIVFSLPANSTITLSGSELHIGKNLIIDGSTVSGVAISGNHMSRVFEIQNFAAETGEFIAVTAALKRLVIKEGNDLSTRGGGAVLNNGTLILAQSTVSGSTANAGGGVLNNSYLTLVDSFISSNTANDGGGIYNAPYADSTLTHSTVSDNTVSGGGGGIVNSGTMTLTDSTVSENTAINGIGGGIANETRATTRIIGSTISRNASLAGGGIFNMDYSQLTLIDSTISSNTVTSIDSDTSTGYGGGVYNKGTLMLTGSTVADNEAIEGGGGIFNRGYMTLTHGTLARNTTTGANDDIYNNIESTAVSAVNTIIQSCDINGIDTKALADNGGNLDGSRGCGFTNASSKSNAALDLGVLADNGGPTLTMLPGAHSDAIGRGVLSGCNGDPVDGKDQRGYIRSPAICTSGAVDPYAAATINLNQHGLNGSWADPTTNSQGVVMEIGPDFYGAGTGLLFAGWYTYDVTAAGGQRWYTLQAQVSGTRPASVGIYSTTGGRLDSPQATSTTEVGRATLTFSDCMHGTIDYSFTDGSGRNGRIPLTRLLSNTTCSPTGDSGAAAAPTLLSGSWADAGSSGQGLVFDMNAADNVIFAGWYTYMANATPSSGAAGQHWFTLQATFKPGTSTPNSIGIYESSGGVFNAPATVQTTQVGTANLAFNSCTSATLKYTFTAGANSGKTGTLDLTRVGAVPSGCHL